MKPIFGIANSNIVDVAFAFKRLKPRMKLFVAGQGKDSDVEKARIFVSNFAGFRRLHKSIPDSCSIFIVDTAINLKRVRKITLLDSMLKKDMSTEFFSITDDILVDALLSREEYPYAKAKFKRFDVSDILLRKTPVSVLSKIFTFLYSIANKEKRDKYRHAILYWLVHPDLDENYLVDILKLKGKGKRLLEFLLTDDILAVRSMFDDSVNYKEIIRKHNIAVFDYNYLNRFKSKTLKGKKRSKKNGSKK